MRLIGDVHGHFTQYERIIKDAPGGSVQVGDLGVGFLRFDGQGYRFTTNPPHQKMVENFARFIPGNHDNPDVCKRHSQVIPSGTLEDGVFYVGGAPSIDRWARTVGVDWWPEEEHSQEELDEFIQKYEDAKPEAVVSHTCPSSIADAVMVQFRQDRIGEVCRTERAFERMLYRHVPKLWVFGHWHHSVEFTQGGCHYVCLNELEHRDDLI